MVGLSLLAAIVCRIGQDAALLQGDGLQLFIGSGETPLLEVEVAALFKQALQLDGASPVVIALVEIGQGLLDRFAIFPGALLLRLRRDHPCREEGQDARKLLFAVGLTPQNSASLLCLAAPLAVSVWIAGADQGGDLLIGKGTVACPKCVQLWPQSSYSSIDNRARDIEQAQRIRLGAIRQADGVAEGLVCRARSHRSFSESESNICYNQYSRVA